MNPGIITRTITLAIAVAVQAAVAQVAAAQDTAASPPFPIQAAHAVAQADAHVDLNPEPATRAVTTARPLVHASRHMVAVANPLATRAGLEILRRGGSVVDAAIAAQLVLGLVEPQSSGIGGGGFALVHRAGQKAVQAYDGRETAPAGARPDRFMRDGGTLAFQDAVDSGLGVGTPGLVRMLASMHSEHGALPWAALFEPAIRLAVEGFPVSPRLHVMLEQADSLKANAAAAAYFFDAWGEPWPVGHVLRNPAYARVLERIAAEGPDAFYTGVLAQDMVRAVANDALPGDLSEQDLAGYRPIRREAVCAEISVYRICGMPPPSSGGVAVIQMMAFLDRSPIHSVRPGSAEAVHYFAEAGSLAYADRDAYVADPDFVPVPVEGLLDSAYLASRAALIRPERSMGRARPGVPAGIAEPAAADRAIEQPATTHLVVADREGNAVSMTTSIEAAFGSKILVNGYLLNNQMTDFSFRPTDEAGRPHPNRVEAGKRPRSSMSPVLVFRDGRPFAALGSPGGSAIINYVAKALVGLLFWDMDIQSAIELPNMGSRNRGTEIEKGTLLAQAVATLKAMGHEVREVDFPSGLQGVVWTTDGLEGGADPRREGQALGD